MTNISGKLASYDWTKISDELHQNGHAKLPEFLDTTTCDELVSLYAAPEMYRKTVVMERYRFGRGEYKYWKYPLPDTVQGIREALYPYLTPIANNWLKLLNLDHRFASTHNELRDQCFSNGQCQPTALILKYETGGYNTLHQDLYGDIFFPLQAACFLNAPDVDYTGGEFVLTEQVPRAQSKATVFKPDRGDLLIFATNYRPVKGSRGYYRAAMRHGVSEVKSGLRHTLGVIFHDATS
jgi:hypothetical protein